MHQVWVPGRQSGWLQEEETHIPGGRVAFKVGLGLRVADRLAVLQQIREIHVESGGPVGVVSMEGHHPQHRLGPCITSPSTPQAMSQCLPPKTVTHMISETRVQAFRDMEVCQECAAMVTTGLYESS